MAAMTKEELKAKIKEAWRKACEYDAIDEDEMFVCFSPDNPFLPEHDRLMKTFQFVRHVDHIGSIGTLKVV